VIAFGEEVARKLAEVEDRDEILKTLRADLDEAAKAYRTAAQALSVERREAASRLAKLAESQINSLAMKVRFEVALHSAGASAQSAEEPAKSASTPAKSVEERMALKAHGVNRAASSAKADGISTAGEISFGNVHWTASGWDQVEYRIATNPGEPLKPLDEIASGGEMSRVMLALKVSVEESAAKPKKKMPAPRTLVFDEIDIGIGGRAAEAVGQKLKSLSRGQQVLCVTHLPQIAAFADHHFAVEKRESGGRTRTQILLLDDRARTHEVARMLSGATVTDASLQHATQMIAGSR